MVSPRIKVNVVGTYKHYHPAERCVVNIRVFKGGDSQAAVVDSVSNTSNALSELFKSLSSKDEPHLPIEHWSMTSLATSSWVPYVYVEPGESAQGTEAKPRARVYKATTGFTVKFRDFQKMGYICLNVAVSLL